MFSLQSETGNGVGGFEFGQSERLTDRLRGLVRNYPKGAGIIKEFIQNADDARATTLRVIFDWRQHRSTHLPHASMNALMGPALLVFNDGLFTPTDVKSIQTIGFSAKARLGPQTGRFGLGFNSVYNLTDYPHFISGDSIYFFDPHANTRPEAPVVPGATVHKPGHGWKVSELWPDGQDLLRPFGLFDWSVDVPRFPGTVFRLPFRTPEQARSSEICAEAFTSGDAEAITQELTASGPELMLFLKHLLSLEVAEIGPGQSKPRLLLSVKTSNVREVAVRETVRNAVPDSPAQMLADLQSGRGTMPVVSYRHRLHVQSASGIDETQTWRVVTGLYLDAGGALLDAMRRMVESEEKAVPWVGAAARVIENKSDVPCDGAVYCFLPLSIKTGLPIHLHGFFDLDSSRQGLTYDRKVIGKDAVRVAWNRQLAEHALARCVARLIEESINDVDDDANLLYMHCPDVSRPLPEPLDSLPTAVMRHLAETKFVRAGKSGDWLAPSQICVIPRDWRADLQPPLLEDGMAIPNPPLPPHILAGFEEAHVICREVSAGEVRNRLRVNTDLAVQLGRAPRACLQKREWVVALLRFCLSNDSAGLDLNGLPLALMLDEKLHTFGYLPEPGVMLMQSQPDERAILASLPHWFVDPDFAAACKLPENPAIQLQKTTPDLVLAGLSHVFGKKLASPFKWNPEAPTPPNDNWLCQVFAYLARITSPKLPLTKNEQLRRLPLVPDQFRQLWPLGSNATPLLPDQAANSALQDALRALRIPLVDGSSELLTAIKRFVQACTEAYSYEFIWGLTARDVIDVLDQYAAESQPIAAQYSPQVHDVLLDFLSEGRSLEQLGQSQNQDRLAKLKSLKLLPTEAGQVVAGVDKNVFILRVDEPPRITSHYHLLKTGQHGQWRGLFDAMDIAKLDRLNVVEQVVLPAYTGLNPAERRRALEWMWRNWSPIRSDLEQRDGAAYSRLRQRVAAIDLVRCSDGKYYPVSRVYDPHSQVVRDILADSVAYFDADEYSETYWRDFFISLGMPRSPQPADLLKHIDALCHQATTTGATGGVASELLAVFEHLQEHWDTFRKAKVVDPQQRKHEVDFVSALKRRAWLPAQRNVGRLSEYPGYRVPPDRLFQPSELYMPRMAHLVASVGPVWPTSEPRQELRQELGFPDSPRLQVVCDHFDRLLSLWQEAQHSGISASAMSKSLGQIYPYFGSLGKSQLDAATTSSPSELSISSIQGHYRDVPCLWDGNGHFWLPRHVFASAVPFFEPRRAAWPIQDPAASRGYDVLGRRPAPEPSDYVDFLGELSREHADSPLSEKELGQVLTVLTRIADESRHPQQDLTWLPTTDLHLRLAQIVHVSDAPWYAEKLSATVDLAHPWVEDRILTLAKAPRLSTSIEERVRGNLIPCEEAEVLAECRSWEKTLRSLAFQEGLKRLIRHHSGKAPVGSLEWLGDHAIMPVQDIETELWLHSGDSARQVGSGQTDYYISRERNSTFLKEQSARLMERFIAIAVNQRLGEERLTDLEPLVTVLSVLPEEIYDVLLALRIPMYQDPSGIPSIDTSAEGDPIDFGAVDEETPYEPDSAPSHDGADDIRQDRPPSEIQRSAEGAQAEDSVQPQPDPAKEKVAQSEIPRDGNRADRSASRANNLPDDGDTHSESERSADPRDAQTAESGAGQGQPKRPRQAQPQAHGASMPRSQRARRKPSQDRLMSYVMSKQHVDREFQADSSDDSRPENAQIGQDAVQHVLRYEREIEGRSAEDMNLRHPNNPGYDVISTAPDGSSMRYIEVKGINGPWDMRGVPVSPTQLECALDNGQEFWLYVVEYACDPLDPPTSARVWRIQDPAGLATQYRFDSGWKDAAQGGNS